MEEKKVQYQKLSEYFTKNPIFTKITTFDCSSNDFNLIDLEDMDLETIRNRFMNLNSLDISRNVISILRIRAYTYLEYIKSTENMISKVELNLPKLKKLDLSNNYIDKIFDLNNVPSLEELRLNKNSLTRLLYDSLKPVKNTLTILELGHNKIDFNTVKDLVEFADEFGKNMRRMRSLTLSGNIFTVSKVYKEYSQIFLHYAEGLKIFNGKNIDQSDKNNIILKDVIDKMQEAEKDVQKENNKNVYKKDNFDREVVTLSMINRELEKYNTYARLNQSNFQNLKSNIEDYLTSGKTSGDDNHDESELEEFDNFLEYCTIMIESSPILEKSIYDIVANFSIVHNGKFSEKCLTFFKNLLAGASSKAAEIVQIIQKSIVEYVMKSSDDNIPSNIIKGLESFATDKNFNSIIKSLLSKIINVIDNLKESKFSGSKLNEDETKKRDVFSNCISFLSTASADEENLTEMICSEKLVNSISYQVTQLLSEGDEILCSDSKALELLQKLLNLIRALTTFKPDEKDLNGSTPQTHLFIEGALFSKIEDNLKGKLTDYIKLMSNNSVDDDPKNKGNQGDLALNKKLMFGNLIRCLGSLSMNDQKKVKESIAPNSVPLKVFSVLTLNNNDPIILSASCDFIHYLFKNEQILNTLEIFQTIVTKISNLRTTIQYLNYDDPKYKNACVIADKYTQGTLIRGIPVLFENMNNELLQKMLISVIKLITFFGKNAVKNNSISQICTTVCIDLNNFERETCLCNCLLVPSDDVKKAAVECLYYVDCDQFSSEEINKIYKQVSNVNLMVGDIEEVVATIYIILTKCFVYFLDSNDKLNRDKIDSNRDAFIVAYEILQKNQERNPKDADEAGQKNLLSLSIITFLNICTSYETIKKHLLDRKNTLKIPKILINEEKFVNSENCYSIEVEKTRGGWSIMNLVEVIKSDNALSPYSYVFLRVLIHLADLLMNIPDTPYSFDKDDEFEEVMDKVKVQVKEREKKRIEYEYLSFRQFIDKKKNKKISKEEKVITISPLEVKEEQAKFVSIFQNFLLFILGKTSHLKISQYERIWDDKFDKKFNNINIELTDLKDKSSKAVVTKKKDGTIFDNLSIFLMEEEMKAITTEKETLNEYDQIRFDLMKYDRYCSSNDNDIARKPNEETANNPYLRAVIIATFLRTIYAILEFPADKDIRNNLILILLKGNNIKDISMLVDSTKLAEFNVSSKYLMIMRSVLINAKDVKMAEGLKTGNVEFNEKEYINQVGTISYLIRKMIRVFKDNLRIDVDDHKILLSELSKCSAVILNELQATNFSDELTREKNIQEMINFDCIKIFIKTVKEYMNKDADMYRLCSDGDSKSASKDDEILNDMTITISNILGEYMSKCKDSSYYILEIFTRCYIFDKVKMRKTYLREIIETSRYSDLKMKIENTLKIKILFMCRTLVLDYKDGLTHVKLFIMTDTALEFINVLDPFDSKSDWDLDKFEFDSKFTLSYEDIEIIYNLQYPNRVIVQSKKTKISLLFMKMNHNNEFNQIVKQFNRIEITNKLKMFGENQTDEEEENKEKEKADEENILIFLALIKTTSLFNIFSIFKDKELLPGASMVVIRGKLLCFYKENIPSILTIDFETLKKNSVSILSNCYTLSEEYDLEDVNMIKYTKTDEMILGFKSGYETLIRTFDDLSYIKLKKAIYPFAKKNNLSIMQDDPYENIN